MVEIPNNGKRLKAGDPRIEKIRALKEESKRTGGTYPWLLVDDIYSVPHVWYGQAPYHAETLQTLRLSRSAKFKPVDLPDHFILDGEAKLPRESDAHYATYRAYRDLGPARTFNDLCRAVGTRPNHHQYHSLSSRFRWAERVAAYDAQMEVEARRALAMIQQDQIREAVERKQTYLDNEFGIVEKGVERINQMLSFPVSVKEIVTEKDEDGNPVAVTIIKPANWTYASMSQFVGEVTKLARLNLGMSTSNASQKIETQASEQPVETKLPEDQAAHEFAARKAEEAYFAALEEYRQLHEQPERIAIAAVTEAAD